MVNFQKLWAVRTYRLGSEKTNKPVKRIGFISMGIAEATMENRGATSPTDNEGYRRTIPNQDLIRDDANCGT